MTLTLQEVAIVVVARNNAPGALHPEFLRSAGIVDGGWQLLPNAPPVSTEVVSQVRFANGLSVLATPDRITVSLSPEPAASGAVSGGGVLELGPGAAAELVAGVAERYIRALPFLQVAAVGVNLVGFQAVPGGQAPAAFLSERFITEGPWKSLRGATLRPSIRLGYEWPGGGLLTLTLDEGTLQPSGASPRSVLVVSANLHRDTATAGPDGAAVAPAGALQVVPVIVGAGREVQEILAVSAEYVLPQEQAAR